MSEQNKDLSKNTNARTLTFCSEDEDQRLDALLAVKLSVSRNKIQQWIKDGLVLVDGKIPKTSEKAKCGQTCNVEKAQDLNTDLTKDYLMPLNILYEDEHIIVLNKARGVIVHPGSGVQDGTLVNALIAHVPSISNVGGQGRPGIVHRLDKDTSGLMVIAKTETAYFSLTEQFAQRTVLKKYQAIVHGVPQPKKGILEKPIGRHRTNRKLFQVRSSGRPARTDYQVIETFADKYALVDLKLYTGRTHQIRIHMTHLGYPLVGDTSYGNRPNKWNLDGQALHCYLLGFVHPATKESLLFEAPMPEILLNILEELRADYL